MTGPPKNMLKANLRGYDWMSRIGNAGGGSTAQLHWDYEKLLEGSQNVR